MTPSAPPHPDALTIPVLPDGTLADLNALANPALTQNPGALVCLMAANNETGVLHPIADLPPNACAAHGALLHIDAVQAAGRCQSGLAFPRRRQLRHLRP